MCIPERGDLRGGEGGEMQTLAEDIEWSNDGYALVRMCVFNRSVNLSGFFP